MRGRKLTQHDRSGFINEATPGHAKDGMLALPRGIFFAENWQVLIRRIFSHGLPQT
jgi:hypothetical protein